MLPRESECAAIDLWLASLEGGDIAALKRVLAPDELARADRFLNTTAAQHYVAARGILREILGHHLNCDPRDVQFEYGEFGKPVLVAGNRTSNLHFNVSHACGYAVYAVCTTAEVGIDIECDDGRIDPVELAPTICSANELRQFQARLAAEQRELFFRVWTRKEAYLKCLGHGLNTEPSSIEMPMGNVPEVYAGTGDLRCSIRTLKPAPGFQVSVAVHSPRSQVQGFRWWPSETLIPR